MVLAREERSLQKRIVEKGKKSGLKCKVVYWENAWDVEEAFAQL